MQLREFFGRLLPSEGHYSLWEKSSKQHYWAGSLDELVVLTDKRAVGKTDWYFATAAFGDITNDDGQFVRTQANVLSKKCFYLDVDAGEAKFAKHGAKGAYPTQRAALVALNEFIKKTGLTPSMLISSGDGVHVYWELEDSVPPDQWVVGAKLLRNACIALEFAADHAVTMDSARILRPIGTLHGSGKLVRELAPTTRLWTLNKFITQLQPYGDVLDSAPPKAVRDINSEVLGSIQGPPSDVRKILPQCGALREAADKRGANASEPMWRAMLGLVKHCVDGERAAHFLSSGHHDYDAAVTQEKLDRWKVGPTTCDTFSEHSAACSTCPHKGKITSPIQLGKLNDREMKVQGIEVSDPEPVSPPKELGVPEGVVDGVNYTITRKGKKYVISALVKRKSPDDDGNVTTTKSYKEFCEDVFWVESWVEAGPIAGEEAHVGAVCLRDGKQRKFDIPNRLVAQPSELIGLLLSQNINPAKTDPEARNLMVSYVNDQIQRIRNSVARPVVTGHYGFQRDKATGDLVCAQGKHYITKDGTIWDALISKRLGTTIPLTIANLGTSTDYRWGSEVWKIIHAGAAQQSLFYRDAFTDPGHQLGIMMHIASPMMVFTADQSWGEDGALPPTGFTLSMYSSKSGRGKSTIQKSAMEAFGSMGLVVAGGTQDMTLNAQVARAAMLGTFAYALDETTDSSPERVGMIINSVAGGSEKIRSNVDGGLQRKPYTWALISSLSTNKPQRELLSQFQKGSDALQMRILELNFDNIPMLSTEELVQFDRRRQVELSANAGSLGAVICYYAVQRGWDHMRRRGQDLVNKLFTMLDNPQEGRFFIRALAAMLLVCEILDELKLPIYQVDTLYSTFLAAYKDGHTYRTEHATGGIPMARRMVNELAGSILITRTDNGAIGGVDIEYNSGTVRQPLAGRRVIDGRYLLLSIQAITAWCAENSYSTRQMLHDMRVVGAVTGFPTPMNLARGVDSMSGVDQSCVHIDIVSLNAGTDENSENVVPIREASLPRTSPPAERLAS
jgi:hypothetical protein